MIPLLTYPLALLGLAAIPALAAVYLLRNRFRRRQVSSLVLWRFQLQSKEGGAKIRRLDLPLLFFLELLTLLLLTAAASGPRWKLPQSARPLIIILDDSVSMRALSENTTAQSRAKRYLENLYRRQPPPSARLILAGTEPRVLGAPAKSRRDIDSLLQSWTCWAPSSAIDAALTLASELGKQQANVLVLTDHAPFQDEIAPAHSENHSEPDAARPVSSRVTGNRLQWSAFGVPVPNFAIVNATRNAVGDEDRCLLEVANFSKTPGSAKLAVRAGSAVLRSFSLSLAPNDRQRVLFTVPSAAPAIEAGLDADALPEDNQVQLLPPIRRRVRVQLLLTNAVMRELMERTLEATGLRAALSQDPELTICQSDAAAAGSNSWTLRWIASEKPGAYTGPFLVDSSHPLGEGIALQGVVWAAADRTNPPGSVPVILAGNVPLLTAREDLLGREQLTLNFSPELSTLQATPDWPILFWNLLNWRASEIPGLRDSNARLGVEVMLKTAGTPVTILQPGGGERRYPKTSGSIVVETPRPGIYGIAMAGSTNWLAVNPLVPDESDLSTCATGQWGRWGDDSERRLEEASGVWIFGLAALALMAVHLCLLATGKGGK